MTKSAKFAPVLATALAAAGVLASPAAAQVSRVEVGLLSCQVAGGAGLVFGSTKDVVCTLQSGDRREVYRGAINKFGIDIGFTGASQMAWAVFAPTSDLRPWALAGGYGGVTGEATIGVGLGANVLVGGSDRSIALQPLSVQSQQGLNLALGVAGLELRPE